MEHLKVLAEASLAVERAEAAAGEGAFTAAREALDEAELELATLRGRWPAMSAGELLQVFANVPSKTIARQADGWKLVSLLTEMGLTASNSEATRLIRSGGIYVNERRITDEKERLSEAQAIDGQLFVIRKGKKDNFLVRIGAASS